MVCERTMPLYHHVNEIQTRSSFVDIPGQANPIEVSGFLPVERVLSIGIAAIEALKVWHDAGFILGSVSLASFAVDDISNLSNFRLVDFSNAHLADATRGAALTSAKANDLYDLFVMIRMLLLPLIPLGINWNAFPGGIDPVYSVPGLSIEERSKLNDLLKEIFIQPTLLRDLDRYPDDSVYAELLYLLDRAREIIAPFPYTLK